jgi:hypothetical protein
VALGRPISVPTSVSAPELSLPSSHPSSASSDVSVLDSFWISKVSANVVARKLVSSPLYSSTSASTYGLLSCKSDSTATTQAKSIGMSRGTRVHSYHTSSSRRQVLCRNLTCTGFSLPSQQTLKVCFLFSQAFLIQTLTIYSKCTQWSSFPLSRGNWTSHLLRHEHADQDIPSHRLLRHFRLDGSCSGPHADLGKPNTRSHSCGCYCGRAIP